MNIGLGIGLQFRRPVSGGGASYLPLTTAYAAATGITDPTELNALNEFEKNIKGLPDASINTTYDFYGDGNFGYVYVNRGSNEVGCETDFIQQFNRQIQNAPTYNNKGVVFDGVSVFATTGFVANTELPDERSGWIGLYYDIGSGSYATGAAQDPNKYNTLAVVFNPTTTTSELSDAGGTPFATDSAVDGVRGAFRISATNVIYQILNTASGGARAFGAHPAIQDTQGGLNYNTDGNVLAFKAITEAILIRLMVDIDAAKLVVLKNILNQFATDLGL
jgi:hypothetical protein